MSHSQQIWKELSDISGLVAKLPTEMPYHVPADYFDKLPSLILNSLSGVTENEQDLASLPKLATPYQVTDTYFDQLPGLILQKIHASDDSSVTELETLSPLLSSIRNAATFKLPGSYFEEFPGTVLGKLGLEEPFDEETPVSSLLAGLKDKSTFAVPGDYFETLATVILGRIESEGLNIEQDEQELLSPLLGQLKVTVPFTLPEGYFEEFAADVSAGVRAVDYVNQELESHPPVMNDLKIKNVYEVPQGYFDQLGDKVLGNIRQQKKTPVISIKFTRQLLRYAAAAVVIGVVSIAAWTFTQDKRATSATSEVSDLTKISNDEIINYLETAPAIPVDNNTTTSVNMKDEDVKEILADLPDEELQQYLDQHAMSKDLIIN